MKLKFRYFFIMILLIELFLQIGRMIDANNYFSIKQIHRFDTIVKTKNTNYKFNNPQKKLIYYNKGSEQSVKILENIEKVFKYNKIDYQVVNIDEVVSVNNYDTFIFATDNFLGFHKVIFDDIINQVNEGKNLIFLSTTEYNPFNELAGIQEMKDEKKDSARVTFTKKFFPGLDEFSPSENLLKYSTYNVQLEENAKVIVESGDKRPVLWEKGVGKGRVLYTNSSFFSDSKMIGLLNQWLGYASDWVIMPILNTISIGIEEFPSNISDEKNVDIEREYYVNQKDFVEKVWWADMSQLGQETGVVYTGGLEISDKVRDKKTRKMAIKDLRTPSERLVGSGGEIAIQVKGEKNISKAEELNELKRYTKRFFGSNTKIYTYISNNFMSNEEMRALKSNYPEMKGISTKFYVDNKLQEIEKNKFVPSMYNIPRFSTGFLYDSDEMWKLYNGVATYGYWSHSINPNDALKSHGENEKGWEDLKGEFQKIVLNVKKNFSFFKPARSFETTHKYMNVENVDIISEKEGKNLKIGVKNYRGKFDTLIRIRYNSIKKVSSGSFKEVYDTGDSKIYLVSIENQNTMIELGDE